VSGDLGRVVVERVALVALYRDMLRIRRVEEAVLERQLSNQLASTMCHVAIGQEAVPVGVCAALGPRDYITSTHRGHGHYLARGGSLDAMFAELYGKATGCCLGRGGSMHLIDPEHGHLGSNAIVGGHIPIATGAALWSSLIGDGRVTVAFFGDGAVTQGVFHEALNFASVRRLPLVFAVENNQWAMTMPWRKAVAFPSVAAYAAGYGAAGDDVDGQDVEAVLEAAGRAVERARAGVGPTVLGLHTYRFFGHSRADACAYRSPDEEAEGRSRDPLAITRARLVEMAVPPEDLDALDEAIRLEIDAVSRRAEEAPDADLGSVRTSVYAS
jgi:acetoin:2,6-dichlorophenolindophenol oxidoreductase subunit alpha